MSENALLRGAFLAKFDSVCYAEHGVISMKRLYDKNELPFSLIWIGIYIVLLSLADGLSASIGVEKLVTAPLCVVLSAGLYGWLKKQGLTAVYGLCPLQKSAKSYLYFLPMILLVSVNLWWGINLQFSPPEAVLYVVSMLCVGFLEEVIFRGFLFKALCRNSIRQAFVISSVTFGVGHIVNLLGGAELIPTLLQICYATAAGFLFTYIFHTCGSLLPCILTHSVINSLSVFAPTAPTPSAQLLSAAFLCVVSVGYGLYLMKAVPCDK